MTTVLIETIRQKIAELSFYPVEELKDETPLFSSGIIDSVSLLELVKYVESECGVRVASNELILENWDSLNQITGYLASKTSGNE